MYLVLTRNLRKMATTECECTRVDCVSANEIRTGGLQMHQLAVSAMSHAMTAQTINSNFSTKLLETMAIKDFKEVDPLESVATQKILAG